MQPANARWWRPLAWLVLAWLLPLTVWAVGDWLLIHHHRHAMSDGLWWLLWLLLTLPAVWAAKKAMAWQGVRGWVFVMLALCVLAMVFVVSAWWLHGAMGGRF